MASSPIIPPTSSQACLVWLARHKQLPPVAMKCTLIVCAVLLAAGIVLAIVGSRYLPNNSLSSQGHVLYAAGWLGSLGFGGLILALGVKYHCRSLQETIKDEPHLHRLLEHGKVVTDERQTRFAHDAEAFGKTEQEAVVAEVDSLPDTANDNYKHPNILKIQEENPNPTLKAMCSKLQTTHLITREIPLETLQTEEFYGPIYAEMKIFHAYICCCLDDLHRLQGPMNPKEKQQMWKEVNEDFLKPLPPHQLHLTRSFILLCETYQIMAMSKIRIGRKLMSVKDMPPQPYLNLFAKDGTVQNNMKKLCVAAVGALRQHLDDETIRGCVDEDMLLTLFNPTTT